MFLLADQIADETAIATALSEACKVLDVAVSAKHDVFWQLAQKMELLAAEDPVHYRCLMRAVSRLESVQSVLHKRRTYELLSENWGLDLITMTGKPVLHVSGSNVSVTERGTDVAWHQDWPNTGGSLNSVVVWVPLGGVSDNTGGLVLAQGEKFGLLDYEIVPPVCKIKPAISERFEPVYVAPKVGAGIIFDQFHPHSSVASHQTRLAVSFRFEDARCQDWRERGYEYLHRTSLEERAFSEWKK